ncbi:hypothetical protein ACFVUH_34510 [Kitasatospora sp. NPDC058032]|uniref:hypothetical protein n=1 Tax=Kitasatospora sp. NPDC058032 TaxID=3346307 RepID=UPI0036DA315A
MKTTSTAAEPSHYTWLITLQFRRGGGLSTVTETGCFHPRPGEPASRAAAFREIRELMTRRFPEISDAFCVLFFSIEPDQL